MNERAIQINNIHLDSHEVRKYWVDCESPDAKRIRTRYQENNYLGSVFSLLIAGIVSTFLARKNRGQSPKKYLHIETSDNVSYCFSEDDVNIDDVLSRLKR
jgi:hypothetical protein